MEALIYLLGLTGQLHGETPEASKHKLFVELRERHHHHKRVDDAVISNSLADRQTDAPRASASEIFILMKAAEHPSASPYTLSKLSRSGIREVRQAVAQSHNTPYSSQFDLARDPDPDVRFALAENHRAFITILETLSDDENPYVSARAAKTIDRLQLEKTSHSIPQGGGS
ncbi:MAG: hypothetical protein KC777_07145 [Cyanobacteria bacterium HKST-UBA02]|nr:hypothetical protein [Cyanobacteria bacterium HKST-UBA02]